MEMPTINDFLSFYTQYSKDVTSLEKGNKLYEEFLEKYNSIDKVISYLEDEKSKENSYLSPVYLYLCIRLQIKCNLDVFKHQIHNSYNIVMYFNMMDESSISICNENYKKQKMNEHSLYKVCSFFIKMCLVSQKSNIRNFTINDIREIEGKLIERYSTINYVYRSILTLLERIIGGKISPYVKRRFIRNSEYKYGTTEKQFIEALDRYYSYIDKKPYKNKRTKQKYKSAIKRFFIWLKVGYPEVNDFNKLERNHWGKYKKNVIDTQNLAPDTRENYVNNAVCFFEWCYKNKFIPNEIVESGERVWLRNHHSFEGNKRMYESREHYKRVFITILTYEPQDEFEELAQHFLLIASACGLRRKELYWLGPGCIVSRGEGVGEITSQIEEKTGIINKITSIMPWGIESVNFLEERFNKGPKIKFYDEESGKEYFSLFEYNGKIIYRTNVYTFFDKIMLLADIRDEEGNIILYKNIKFHAFRHQKYNDIYEITKGNLSAVQSDSNHDSMAMLRNYVVQNIGKKRKDSVKLLEKGLIVGRSAKILNAMLETPYAPDELLGIIKKMNVSLSFLKENIKNIIMDLGFGFCSSTSCNLSKICESCIYFFTCGEFIEQLQNRYINNFFILQYKMVHEGKEKMIENEKFGTFVKDLKYQEKWLMELGMSIQEIHSLRLK